MAEFPPPPPPKDMPDDSRSQRDRHEIVGSDFVGRPTLLSELQAAHPSRTTGLLTYALVGMCYLSIVGIPVGLLVWINRRDKVKSHRKYVALTGDCARCTGGQ